MRFFVDERTQICAYVGLELYPYISQRFRGRGNHGQVQVGEVTYVDLLPHGSLRPTGLPDPAGA